MADKFKLALTFVQQVSDGKKSYDGINLEGTTLGGLVVHQGSSLNRVIFRDCRLTAVTMNRLSLKSAVFDGADLREALISESNCQGATFLEANLSRANFSKSRLTNANLGRANLRGANFMQADVRGVDFRGAILSQAEFRGAFYDDKTLFDEGVNPTALGLRKVGQTNAEKNTEKTDVASVQTQPKKKIVRMYRGQPLEDFSEPVVSVQPEKPQSLEKRKKKLGLTYRGVKL